MRISSQVAFKFSMTSFIPKISYQTYLDYYNLICISALALVIVENFFVSWLLMDDSSDGKDDKVCQQAKDDNTTTECSSNSFFGGTFGAHVKNLDFYFIVAFNVFWIFTHFLILLALKFGWFYQHWADVRGNDAVDNTQRIFSDLQ